MASARTQVVGDWVYPTIAKDMALKIVVEREKAYRAKQADKAHPTPPISSKSMDLFFKQGGQIVGCRHIGTQFFVVVRVTAKGVNPPLDCHFKLHEITPYERDRVAIEQYREYECKDWLLENWFGDRSMQKEAGKLLAHLKAGVEVLSIDKFENMELFSVRIPQEGICKVPTFFFENVQLSFRP